MKKFLLCILIIISLGKIFSENPKFNYCDSDGIIPGSIILSYSANTKLNTHLIKRIGKGIFHLPEPDKKNILSNFPKLKKYQIKMLLCSQ